MNALPRHLAVRKSVVGLTVTIAASLACPVVASAAQNAAPAQFAPGPATPSLTNLVQAMGANQAEAADARYAYLRKLDSHLQEVAADRLENRDLTATAEREALELSQAERRGAGDVYVTRDTAGPPRAR